MLSDGVAQPAAPNTYAIYRGFYIFPGDNPLPGNLARVDYFRCMSTDETNWTTPTFLEYGLPDSGLYVVDTELDENTFYGYYCIYVFTDGSKTGYSQMADAGNAQLTPSYSLNIDGLASEAYSTGLITSGVFRGVEFQTNQNDPKVQMDPTGLWATAVPGPAGGSTPVFYLHSDGSSSYFQGRVDAVGLNLELAKTGSSVPESSIQWISNLGLYSSSSVVASVAADFYLNTNDDIYFGHMGIAVDSSTTGVASADDSISIAAGNQNQDTTTINQIQLETLASNSQTIAFALNSAASGYTVGGIPVYSDIEMVAGNYSGYVLTEQGDSNFARTFNYNSGGGNAYGGGALGTTGLISSHWTETLNATWTAGTWILVNITHNLGCQPFSYAVACVPGGTLQYDFYVCTAAADTTYLGVYLYNGSGADQATGATLRLGWTAFIPNMSVPTQQVPFL